MLSARRLISQVVIIALLVTATGTARAQDLDGKWFKLAVSSKGVTVDAAHGDALVKASFKTTAFLLLTFNGATYDFVIRTETAPGDWTQTDSFTLNPLIANESLGSDDTFYFDRLGGTFIFGVMTYRINIKRNLAGDVVSATFKTLGGEATADSTADGANVYRGNVVVTGKTIDPSKLPFTP